MSPTRARRTQAERRETTRVRILTCTAESLVERGYAATTVSEVQQRAGLARGTVQHHFPTRAELLVAAAAHVVSARIEAFRREIANVPDEGDRIEVVVNLAWRDLGGAPFYAALELWVAARTDAELRRHLVGEEQRLLLEVQRLYAEALGERFATDPRTDTLVEFTMDLLTGLSMSAMLTGRITEREATLRRWKRALAVLIGQLSADELLEGAPLRAPVSE